MRYRILLFVLLLIWIVGIFSEQLALVYGNILLFYPILRKGYSLVCHQEESKLIYFHGAATLVCARCTGIYLGLLIAALTNIFIIIRKTPNMKLLFIFATPMLVDIIFYSAGVYSYSKVVAFATGVLFGSVGFLYFYRSVNDFLNEIQIRK